MVDAPTLSSDGQSIAFAWRGDLWSVSSQGGLARQLTASPSQESQPRYSPDGTKVAFVSDREGSSQLYVMPADGGLPQQVTFHSEGGGLHDWFPDGQSLLMLANRDHFWRAGQRFFRVAIEARQAEQLLFNAYGDDGQLSPDGKQLLFTREGERWWRKGYRGSRASQIWLFDLETGQFRKLLHRDTECRSPLWKADGTGFYYVGNQSGSFNLWEHRWDNDEEHQWTDFDDDSVVAPTVARDGSQIVFRHLFDLYRLRLQEGGRPEQLEIRYAGDLLPRDVQRRTRTEATDVAFSHDGLDVALLAGGDLWVMDTELREPRQVSRTAEEERDPVFVEGGDALLFVSDGGGQSDIWRAARSDPGRYWWQNDQFDLKQLTHDGEVESQLRASPDGLHVAFVRGRGDLWIMRSDGSEARRLVASWSAPEFDWAPDGKWLVYAQSDADFNREIFVVPVDGSREPFNLSRHPRNDGHPRWSPDGKAIAFVGQRSGEEQDIYYVYLQAADDEQTSRERIMEKAIEKIQKVRKDKPPAKTEPAGDPPAAEPAPADPDPAAGTGPAEPAAAAASAAADSPDAPETDQPPEEEASTEDEKPVTVVIDFEGIHDRLRHISIPDSTESDLVWSHDSKKLAFTATVDGKRGTYTVAPPDELQPQLLSTKTGLSGRWIKTGNQIVWLSDGVPASLTADGKDSSYPFTVWQETDVSAELQAAFDLCWRAMRDGFYDARLNDRNWDAIRRKYQAIMRDARDRQTLANAVALMLGELNASHLGFTLRQPSSESSAEWREETAHLGLRWDPDYKGPGWRVRDVLREGPASESKSRIEPGEIVLSVDGTAVDPDLDVSSVLNGRLARDVILRVRGAGGEERDVTLRPISYAAARTLLYEMWIEQNRAAVERQSDGALGYLHIRGMNMPSFYRFEEELYKVGAGKQGLVIDVRDNGGGFTTDHLLTALTQPWHAITVPRGGEPGYPQDRMVYASWRKPVIVLCNQNSFSNAEIFSHAIKQLKRGRLVGVTTAGGVISTGAQMIMDMGVLRMPFRGWFVAQTGEDMELNGAVPHHEIWPEPGEMSSGKDRQLELATRLLRKEADRWRAKSQRTLRTASERRQGGSEARP